ncbi:MAG: hypothetical protein ACK4XK_03365 [Casimicrobiaceae bacterium]
MSGTALPHPDPPPERAATFIVVMLILSACAIFALAARWALEMHGFAEDLGLTHDLARDAGSAVGWEGVWQRWVGPLWGPGSSMWRPWAYTSLALDAWLWGADGRLWHLTNLALHASASGITALLAWHLMQSRLAAASAFAAMLLNPWSPEILFWLVGRFDGWATTLMLLSLVALGADRFKRALAVSLLAAAGTYLSKESALLLPVLVAIVIAVGGLREQRREAMVTISAHLALAILYLALRMLTVGTSSTAVYALPNAGGNMPFARVRAFFDAFTAHARAMAWPEPAADGVGAALVAVTALAFVLALSSGRGELRRTSLLAVLWIGAVLAAVALHFPHVLPGADGARLYYAAAPAHALLLGAGFAGLTARRPEARSIGMAFGAVFLLLPNAVLFAQGGRAWQQASRHVEHAADAIAQIVRTHRGDRGYGLVMLADREGAVPLFRNAQGGILSLAARRSPDIEPAVDFVVPMTDRQIEEWGQLMKERVVTRLTPRNDAPEAPTQFWCLDAVQGQAIALGHWPPDEDWPARWRESARRCVGLSP